MLTKRDKNILKFIETYGSATISIVSKVFYKGHKFAYDEARRRLRKIAEISNLKHVTNKATKEYIYYMDKPLSPHGIFTLDFYAELYSQGCENIKFQKRKFSIKPPVPDGFFEFVFNDQLYLVLLEVDFTHNCDVKNYERLYDTGELQEMYKEYKCGNQDIFPKVVVMKQYIPTSPYYSNNFEVVYMDYKLTDFAKKILI